MVDHLAVSVPGLLQCSPDVATRQVYTYDTIATMPGNGQNIVAVRACKRDSESSLAVVSWDIVNRALHLMLWVFEVLAIVGLILALTLPIQDYAFRAFFQWKHHPSPDTYEAYLEKQRQERTVSTRRTSGESDLGRPVSVVAESRLRVSPRHSPFYCRFQ